jgi:hypothetical protein
LVTPLYARVGRKLINSLHHPTVVRDDTAKRLFEIQPVGVQESIASALRNEDFRFAQTRWSDALSAAGTSRHWGGVRFGNRLVDSRSTSVAAAPFDVFAAIERIGGETGWYYANWLLHQLVFAGMLRGLAHASEKNDDNPNSSEYVNHTD